MKTKLKKELIRSIEGLSRIMDYVAVLEKRVNKLERGRKEGKSRKKELCRIKPSTKVTKTI